MATQWKRDSDRRAWQQLRDAAARLEDAPGYAAAVGGLLAAIDECEALALDYAAKRYDDGYDAGRDDGFGAGVAAQDERRADAMPELYERLTIAQRRQAFGLTGEDPDTVAAQIAALEDLDPHAETRT
jgi:hypothetical protein